MYIWYACVYRVYIKVRMHVRICEKSLSIERLFLPVVAITSPFTVSYFFIFFFFFLSFSISFNIARKKYVYKRILLPTIVMNTLFCLFYIFFYLPSRGHCTRSSLYKHVFRYISAIGRDNDVFFSFSHARPYITNILILLISFDFLFFSVNYSIHRHIFIYIFSS